MVTARHVTAAVCDWSGSVVPADALHPEEAALLATLPGWRRQEWTGVRLLAHELLAQSGWSGPVLAHEDGAPHVVPSAHWLDAHPPAASLSHAGEMAAAAVAPAGCAVGVDITALEEDNVVLLPRLLRLTPGCSAGDWTPSDRASVLLSLAEAAFKALRPARGGLAAAALNWDGASMTASVHPVVGGGPVLQAAVLLHAGHVLSLVTAGNPDVQLQVLSPAALRAAPVSGTAAGSVATGRVVTMPQRLRPDWCRQVRTRRA